MFLPKIFHPGNYELENPSAPRVPLIMSLKVCGYDVLGLIFRQPKAEYTIRSPYADGTASARKRHTCQVRV